LLLSASISVAVPADRRSPQPTIAQRFSALALIERFVHPLDRQLAGVKLTLSPNRNTVTADPKATFRRASCECYARLTPQDRHLCVECIEQQHRAAGLEYRSGAAGSRLVKTPGLPTVFAIPKVAEWRH